MKITKENMRYFPQTNGIKKIFKYVEKDPERNISKLLDALQVFDKWGGIETQLSTVTDAIGDKNGNWFELTMKFFKEINPSVRKKVFENMIINASIIGKKQQKHLESEHNCNFPWAIFMDLTSTCSLHCTGCCAPEYGNSPSLSFEEWDSIIEQGKEMGVYMYIYSGGEPLIRKREIIQICEKHSDCMFLSFTNGTLIDDNFADEMCRVGNFVPAISVEGYAEETDSRRGEGCYEAVIKAMDILNERNLLFGISCCYTRNNAETVGSEKYFDDMINKGALFAWFYTYVPVGAEAVTELLVTPEQQEYMYYQIRNFRETKPLFTLNFLNDSEYIHSCTAGGGAYLHININGDVEPCTFIHYSDSNIRNKSILEACKLPLLMQYAKHKPFNYNMLQPCPLLDNPEYLITMVENSGAKSTDLQHPENVYHCSDVANKWAVTAKRLWTEHPPKNQKQFKNIAS